MICLSVIKKLNLTLIFSERRAPSQEVSFLRETDFTQSHEVTRRQFYFHDNKE
jgi:hypothetical protein